VSKIWSSDKNTNELEYGWLYICVYFDFLYGTLRVLFSIDVHIDRLKTFIYFLFLFSFCLWHLSVNDHTGEEYATLAQPQSINRKHA